MNDYETALDNKYCTAKAMQGTEGACKTLQSKGSTQMDPNDLVPEGVALRDFDDHTALRNSVFETAKESFASKFPQEYGKYRMEVEDLGYMEKDDFDLATQKRALMTNQFLAKRLQGTLKLYDKETGELVDSQKKVLMRVPYVTDRGTTIHNGNEYVTLNQARLSSGIYTRQKATGEIEAQVNAKRGTGKSYKVRLEPESSLYKLDIDQASLRLYSLLRDIGVSDDEMEKRWGPEVLQRNAAKYDPRTLDKAYKKLVRRPAPDASREDKVAAIKEALGMTMVSRGVVQRTLPNLFNQKTASVWRKAAYQGPAAVPQGAKTEDEYVKWDQKRQEQEQKAKEQQQKADAKRDLELRKQILEISGLNSEILAEDGSVDPLAVIKQVMQNIQQDPELEKGNSTKTDTEENPTAAEAAPADRRLPPLGPDITGLIARTELSQIEIVVPPMYDPTAMWKEYKRNRKKYRRAVRKIQAGIVRSYRKGKLNQAKELQEALVSAFVTHCLAVDRVTSSKGSDTPGVDGVTWKEPASKWEAVLALSKQVYKAQPLRRIELPKPGSTKKRPLGIPTMMDRAMQEVYRMALDPIAEETADPNSYGFRRHRSTHDAIEQVRTALSGEDSPEWILDADIEGCFDNIAHDWLQEYIPLEKGILRQWLHCGFVDKHQKLHPTIAGTPQGGVISPCLCNMTLDGLEKVANEAAGSTCKVHFVRYADDFLVMASDKVILERSILPAIRDFLQKRGLNLSEAKTSIRHVEEGVDFLGQHIRKINGKIKITPSEKNVSTFLATVGHLISGYEGRSLESLLVELNPKIVGWANYHCHVDAKEHYDFVDLRIHQMVWRFLQGLHDGQPNRWIESMYFHKVPNVPGGGTFIDALSQVEWGGDIRFQPLVKASMTKTIPHIKVKAKLNPYDRDQKAYFERLVKKRKQNRKVKNCTNVANGPARKGSARCGNVTAVDDKNCPLLLQNPEYIRREMVKSMQFWT
jgi:RNA-directed DNA polymerase